MDHVQKVTADINQIRGRKILTTLFFHFALVESLIIASIFFAILPRIQLIKLRDKGSVLAIHGSGCLPLRYDGKKYWAWLSIPHNRYWEQERGYSFPEQKPEQDRIFHHVFKAAVNPFALAVSILAHCKAE
jgi:hypothetical protein